MTGYELLMADLPVLLFWLVSGGMSGYIPTKNLCKQGNFKRSVLYAVRFFCCSLCIVSSRAERASCFSVSGRRGTGQLSGILVPGGSLNGFFTGNGGITPVTDSIWTVMSA